MTSNSPAEPSAKPPRLRRWLVRAGFVLACLATLIVALYLEEKIRGRAAWRAYENEAKQRGVKLAFADYLPPNIPDAENFASIPIFDAIFRASDAHEKIPNPFRLSETAGNNQPKFSDPIKQERIDLAAWQKFFVETQRLPAAGDSAAADVLRALDTFAAPLAQLREAGTRPHCRFPVHWEKLYSALLPHLEVLRDAARLDALRLSAHLALGQSAAAGEDFRDGLRLVTATREDPPVISGLVRIAIATMMENAVWDGLAGHQWAEPELRKIEADLMPIDWLTDYLSVTGTERGAGNGLTEMLITDPRPLAALMGSDGTAQQPMGDFGLSLYPAGWFYQSMVRENRYFDEMSARIDTGRRRYFGERPVPSSVEDIRTRPQTVYYLLLTVLAPALENLSHKFVQTATMTDLARLACALENFRIARGALPEALAALTPDFLASLPAEIVNGEPYRYRRTGDGAFLLYSVGLNLRDDGGVSDPKASSAKQADWVWRYPAP